MKEYLELNIYIGLPPKSVSNKKFNIYTDIDHDKISLFKNKEKLLDNKNSLFINGLPQCVDRKKIIYWHKYNDERFDGIMPNENIFKEFPNLKLISKKIVNSISLDKYLNFGLLISSKANIYLTIRQGNLNEILESIGSWIQQVSRIELIGLPQTYLLNNSKYKIFLDKNGFTKNTQENFSEIIYSKSINQTEKNPELKNKGKIMKKILAEIDNKNSSRLNLIKKETYEALNNKNENIFLALSFYLNKFEFKKDNNDIDIELIREIRILSIGAEGIIILVNNSVIKVYRDKYFRMKNEFKNNHEPEFLIHLNSDFFPKPKNSGFTYMELDYLGAPIGTPNINLMNPYDSVRISGDVILSALSWIKELDEYINKNKIIHRDIQLSNILYDNVLNKFTLIDFTHSRSEIFNGLNFKKELHNISHTFIEDSKAIESISNILIQKLVFEYIKANQIDDYYASESVFNFLNDEELKLSDNNFEDDKVAEFIIKDTAKLKKKVVFHNLSLNFTMLGLSLLRENSSVIEINDEINCIRIYKGLKIKNNLENFTPFRSNLSSYQIRKSNYHNILIISDIDSWINCEYIDEKFDCFIISNKSKIKMIYIKTYLSDDLKRYFKIIKNYFSKLGFLTEHKDYYNLSKVNKKIALFKFYNK